MMNQIIFVTLPRKVKIYFVLVLSMKQKIIFVTTYAILVKNTYYYGALYDTENRICSNIATTTIKFNYSALLFFSYLV